MLAYHIPYHTIIYYVMFTQMLGCNLIDYTRLTDPTITIITTMTIITTVTTITNITTCIIV